jgi:hypothetical protein
VTDAAIGSELMERSARQAWPYAIAAVAAAVLLLVGGRDTYDLLIASVIVAILALLIVLMASWGLFRGSRGEELLNRAWMASVLISFATGVAFWLGHPENLGFLDAPKGLGYYIASASFVGGLAFGPRGAVFSLVGLSAYGTGFIGDTISPPSGDDQRVLYILFVTILAAVFMVPTFIGALIRSLVGR